jgi:hypothetical protein
MENAVQYPVHNGITEKLWRISSLLPGNTQTLPTRDLTASAVIAQDHLYYNAVTSTFTKRYTMDCPKIEQNPSS